MLERAMRGQRAAWVVLALLAPVAGGQERPGFQKNYFGATVVGSWAKYRMTSPGAQEGSTTYTRLPDDEDERQRLLVRIEFSMNGRRTVANNEYTFEKGFSLLRDAIGFGKAIESASSWQGSGEAEDLPDEAIEDLQRMAPDFGSRAIFVGAETISGRQCDHYRYTQRHPGEEVTFEHGDVWLDPTLPFGVVRQAGVLKDEGGRTVSSYAMLLADSGRGATPPRQVVRRAAGTTPVKLAEAYGDGQVEVRADIAGGSLKVSFKNISQDSLRLTIPSGPTALEVGPPVGTLRLESPSTWLFDLAPGEASETVELGQGGSPRVATGKFSAHLSNGKPVFSGDASLDAAR